MTSVRVGPGTVNGGCASGSRLTQSSWKSSAGLVLPIGAGGGVKRAFIYSVASTMVGVSGFRCGLYWFFSVGAGLG